MNTLDVVVGYDDLIAEQEFHQLADFRQGQEVAAKPAKQVIVTVTHDVYLRDTPAYKPSAQLTESKPTKGQAAAEAAIDATLCKGFFGLPKAPILTADRLGMLGATIRASSRGHWSMRRGGLSALTIARRELGMDKRAGKDEVLAEIATRIGE